VTGSMLTGGGVPLVSVIIPAYNAAATIAATLNSVQRQTHEHLEIIVVDDGSTDRTAAIVTAHAAGDPRVRLIRQANSGVISARNRGIAAARGAFIAPVDADDLWHPEKIEAQLVALRDHPNAGMAYCWYWSIDLEGRLVGGAYTAVEPEEDAYAEMVLNSFVGASTPLFHAPVLRAIGGYDERFGGSCADCACHLAVAARSSIIAVPRFLVGHRLTPGSMSQNSEAMFQSYTRVMATVRRNRGQLPERLFRWSRAKVLFRLAQRAPSRSASLRLMLKALAIDPLLPLTLPVHKVLTTRLGLPLRGSDRHLAGRPFLPPPPDLETFVPAAPTLLERRRRRSAGAKCRQLSANS
jgi:GT2 family glycosyltransferase